MGIDAGILTKLTPLNLLTFKGIKQEPLDLTPYNVKAEYCRIITS